jgi:predicted RNA-binding protein with PIN domain
MGLLPKIASYWKLTLLMHYLIDGHNLIAARPDISLDDPDDEIKLILVLKSWAVARRKREVTVIFDRGLPGGFQQRLSSSRINVVFASQGETADSLLIRRIKQLRNPSEYILVSSDQAIQTAAGSRRLAYLASEEFAGELVKKEPSPPPAAEKLDKTDEPSLTQEEVTEWLDLFGPVPEPKPETAEKAVRRRKTAAEKPPSPSAQETKSSDHSPGTAKRGDRKLSREEVDEWLDLFKKSG